MNGRSLTDAQIARALRARLPARAQPGLQGRTFEVVENTSQQRPLPPRLRALSDADQSGRVRTLLIAAAILIAVALASAAVVGALHLFQPDPESLLSLEPPVNTSPAPSESARPTASTVTRTTAAWVATASMLTPRAGHTAVRLLDGRVLVAGGSGGSSEGPIPEFDVTSTELYDPESATWSATGTMIHPYAGFPATLLRDGKVLAGDVRGDPSSPTSGAELFDPVTGTWTSTGTLAFAVEWLGGTTATLLGNGKVLVAGFRGSELYDPDSGTWAATGSMVTPRYNHTATLLADGRVLVAGGDVPPDRAVDSAELYDPDTGAWTATANLRATGNTRFDVITATQLQDGMVLVVRPSSAELYDPATETWAAAGEQPRAGTIYRAATLLSDGTVLVPLSDDEADGPGLTAAVLYDPGTGSWTPAASMFGWHSIAPATLLLDGTVLVAGGLDCRDGCPAGATGSAELYVPAGVSLPAAVAALPSPTPTPIPIVTPAPTPYPPEAGPIPPDARPWKVMVVNESSAPTTLFVAEEAASGLGRLVGSVTPNVVPPGVTMEVTFLLPAKGVTDWWIFVNPGQGGGALLGWDEVPRAGKILVMEGGQTGWAGL